MDRCLTDLELRPDDSELLSEIFRAVHTIKGTTGFLGFSRLEKLAHAGENLLGSLRDGRLKATPNLVTGLLRLMDGLRSILGVIEKTGKEGSRASDNDDELIAVIGELNRAASHNGDDSADLHVEAREIFAEEFAGTHEPPVKADLVASSGLGEKTLRIDVEVLNRMMNLVGELVLTRNQLLQSNVEAAIFPELARRLDSVTADLRETVMQARMQPVGHLFQKFPRMVRDLAKSCGKHVRIEFSGQETGLDKSLLEAIKDPLTHAVRNAVDHGIEEPQQRARAGKPVQGVVRLTARQHNGAVMVEISDDGGGISPARVLKKAIERQLVTEEQAAAMTEREVLQMIFLPGFSTAAAVTHVSGRGVGMDVVLANVEKVGGTVELESHEGKGTTLRMRVPLTLAIVRALVVRSGGQSFCLPQGALAELVYVPSRDAAIAVERIGEAEVYRLRERLLPMVRLDRLLGLDAPASQPAHLDKTVTYGAHGFYLVVLETEGCRYGLVVDDLMAPEEIVVKPLSAVLREIGVFSGATVLGNGALAMILDVAATAHRAGVRPETEENAPVPMLKANRQAASSSFLIFEDRVNGRQTERMALPLSAVERIETVALHQVEYAGGRPLLQYRGELLPLVDAGGVLRELMESGNEEASATVLICDRASDRAGDRAADRTLDRSGPAVKAFTQRLGMVVRRVVDVATGELMDRDVQICDERLAMVNDRLTVVHEAFAHSDRWRNVA